MGLAGLGSLPGRTKPDYTAHQPPSTPPAPSVLTAASIAMRTAPFSCRDPPPQTAPRHPGGRPPPALLPALPPAFVTCTVDKDTVLGFPGDSPAHCPGPTALGPWLWGRVPVSLSQALTFHVQDDLAMQTSASAWLCLAGCLAQTQGAPVAWEQTSGVLAAPALSTPHACCHMALPRLASWGSLVLVVHCYWATCCPRACWTLSSVGVYGPGERPPGSGFAAEQVAQADRGEAPAPRAPVGSGVGPDDS